MEDLCNNREEALANADCELKPGVAVERFLALAGDVKAGDEDWYSIRIPSNANARTLVHISAGYLSSSRGEPVGHPAGEGQDTALVPSWITMAPARPSRWTSSCRTEPGTQRMVVVRESRP